MSNVKFSQLPNLANITASTIVPVVDSNTNYTVTAANLQSYVNNSTGNITGANLVATANVMASGNVSGTYILGNGSLLTGLPATYGNANVATYLPTYTGNLAGGNIAVSSAATVGTLTASGNITGANVVASANVVAGSIKTDNYLYANGTPISFSGTYGNANVAAYLPVYAGNLSISSGVASGNITATYFLGDGGLLSNVAGTATNSFGTVTANGANLVASAANSVLTIAAGTNIAVTGNATSDTVTISVTGTVANATYATSAGSAATATTATTATSATTATTATTAGTVTSASQPAITSVGTLTSLAVTGNVSANYFVGNGSALTGIATTGNYVDVTTNQTVAGNKTFSGTTTLDLYVEKTTSGQTTSTSFTPNVSNGIIQRVTANANFTLNSPTGMAAGQNITLIITQDGTGSRIMTPNGVYKFAYGLKLLSTSANAIDMLSIFYDGSNYLCNLTKGYTA